jgi:hypothetical protein
MGQKTITSANTIFAIAVAGVIPAPVQLQGFTADDVFDIDQLEVGVTTMGVDGILSAGFVFNPVKQTVTLQADSDSNVLFETWYAAEKAQQDKFFANGTVVFKSVGRSYVLTKGALVTYSPAANPGKTLKPRSFAIEWQAIDGAPV